MVVQIFGSKKQRGNLVLTLIRRFIAKYKYFYAFKY